MSSRFGSIVHPSSSRWLAQRSETLPIIGLTLGALGWSAYNLAHASLYGPDVSFSRARRGTPLKAELAGAEKEASAWVSGHGKYAAKHVEDISAFIPYERRT